MEGSGDITLAIETSNPSAAGTPGVCVGILDEPGASSLIGGMGVRVLANVAVTQDARTQRNEDRLMLAVDEAMRVAGLTPRQIKRIAVSLGPGGFTSVRLAVTTAKCIAEVTGAACIGVATASVAAMRFGGVGGCRRFAVALASKGSDAYVQAFDAGDGESLPRALTVGGVVDADGLARLVEAQGIASVLADGFLPEAMRARAAGLGVEMVPLELDPVACLAASRGIVAVDPVALLPIYPREPEAVTKWRVLHGDRKPR